MNDIQHVNVKLFLHDDPGFDLERLVPVFHRWIQEQSREELLIDVADYRHVPAGPGVMIIGHQANYSVDNAGHRLGVRYNRKAPLAGSNADRLAQAARAALAACQALESDPELEGKFRFNGQEIEISINDRLLAPNNDATRAALESEFKALFRRLFSSDEFTLKFSNHDARQLFAVTARALEPVPTSQMLARLEKM
jgi:hypothetical protein